MRPQTVWGTIAMSHNWLDTIIRGASVITGDGATFLENACIGIGEGRIAFVQPGNMSVNADEVDVMKRTATRSSPA